MTERSPKMLDLPDPVPTLPVRNTVLFPNAAVPLIVGRPKSVRTLKRSQKVGDILLVVAQKDGSKEDPAFEDLYRVGVICLVSKISQIEKDSYQLIANGLFRFEISEFLEQDGTLCARGSQISDSHPMETARIIALAAEIKELGKAILNLAAIPGSDALIKLFNQITEPSQIADLCGTFLQIGVQAKQQLLEVRHLENRLEMLLDYMVKEKEKLVLQSEIQAKMMERLSKDQRDHLLREQIRTISEELGDESNIQDEFTRKIEEAQLSPEARKVAKDELTRLSLVQRTSPEYHVIRTYLEWLVALPWEKTSGTSPEKIDLREAKKILDEDHYGLEKVKKRILQFLAVNKLKNDMKGPILCLVGPPGVGKTSMGRSIARALGRAFIRTSLGGVRDEAEIRGHRRTYIGALPGRIIQNMKRTAVKDPLILLDEVDKIGTDFRGDPSSALLEVLDPEQNNTFMDHYLDVPFDLSRVFFITTANQLDTIPPALRDRLEIIEMVSYSKKEKLEIAMRHLVPKALRDHGLSDELVVLPAATIEGVIDHYTREPGVRNLTREIAHLCRAAAEKIALADGTPKQVTLSPDTLDEILGPQKYFLETVQDRLRPGVVTGLAWTPTGGDILHIEVTHMPGKGKLMLTGQLGEVMKESAQIAVSLVRAFWYEKLPFKFDETDFHIHVPAGAIPKDGPSAGVAIFTALASLVSGRPVDSKLAMTGEITLRGNVLPVGGVKEKVLAAHRAGIRTICLPQRNEGDLRDVGSEVKDQLRIHYVKDLTEILKVAGLEWTLDLLPAVLEPVIEKDQPTIPIHH